MQECCSCGPVGYRKWAHVSLGLSAAGWAPGAGNLSRRTVTRGALGLSVLEGGDGSRARHRKKASSKEDRRQPLLPAERGPSQMPQSGMTAVRWGPSWEEDL